FRKTLLPALLRRWIRPLRLENLSRRLRAKRYLALRKRMDRAAHDALRTVLASLGPGGSVKHPWHVVGGEHIRIGRDFWACADVRLEAWDHYQGATYRPVILIGDHVALNNGVHVGAIDRIEIGNNVIVGANALITDHSHGDMGPSMLQTPARDCPLHSRGPVLIEDDVWIGEGACILSGVRVGKGAVVGANAVVVRDVAPGEIVGGVPARRIRHLGDAR
ncbi:MAG TPA: acyltransferase, partial [Fibrobacteria bacterium]|nr:acyltransferase [Fibrobacteria bacterium]